MKKRRLAGIWQTLIQMSIDLSEDHIGAYSAMAAFFLMLSLIPMLVLLVTLVQYIPVSRADLVDTVNLIFPTTISPLIREILDQVYITSGWTIPVTVVVAIWAAGKSMMALGRGLNCIHDMLETRNYFIVRFRACVYTLVMILTIAISMLVGVFGKTLMIYLGRYLPASFNPLAIVLRYKVFLVGIVVSLMAWGLYIVLPNKKVRKIRELPGAVFTGITWSMLSSFFSRYLQWNTGFASMYGTMTTIILMMMWMYFLMYLLLLGGEINSWFVEYEVYASLPFIRNNYKERQERYLQKKRAHNMELLLKQAQVHKRLEPGRRNKKSKQIEEGSHER